MSSGENIFQKRMKIEWQMSDVRKYIPAVTPLVGSHQ